MASSGKKGKKTKGKTLALTDFLQETPGATPTLPIRKTNLNWADEVEDVCDQYDSRPKANVVLPTAPKASRGFDEFSEKIPQQPPYIAYLSNLPYDVNEDEISEFFGDLKIQHMRIPKEDRAGEGPRLKGFGYVEFEDRESLVGALSITDCTLKNRRIRIEIATNLDNDRRRGGRMDNNRDRMDRAETSGDWRSGPRVEPSEPERSRGGGGGFSRDRDRDNASFERDRGADRAPDRGGSWRDSSDRPSFRDTRDTDRDRGFYRDSDRGGGFRDGPRDGFGERGRFSDRDGDKRSFGPRRADRDDREFTRGGGGRDDSRVETSEPRTRPKLVLAPRSKPAMAESDQEAPPPETIPTSVPAASSSSIFGNAKPVDTSARERQIEDKLAKETEKTGNDSSRISRRDNDRRDWGRKEEDVKSQDLRRDSPRRGSPRRYSPRRSSPDYSPSRNKNYDRRGDSPDDRKGSPDRRGSPERRRASPYRRGSAEYRKSSPDRRSSPEYRKGSPDRRRASPDQRRGSPDRRWASPQRRRDSPERRRPSPDYRKGSPDRRRRSPDRTPITRGAPQRKTDDKDKRGPPKTERPPQRNDKEKPRRDDKISRDNHDREMPKLKEPEPPNFAVSNKYAFLEPEEDSD